MVTAARGWGRILVSRRAPAALELFAGAGGMALGTERAGFRHVALLEWDEWAVSTLRGNAESGVGPSAEIEPVPTDVRAFTYDRVPSDMALLAAGAPCQPFSLGGVHRGAEDGRNLFPEVFRAQRELWPKAILLENVRGLARPSFRPYLNYILLQLALPTLMRRTGEDWRTHSARLLKGLDSGRNGSETYDVWIAAIECANFGAPQRRNRVFMVGFRSDLRVRWEWPHETHSEAALAEAKYVSGTYWREHGIEPPRGINPSPRLFDLSELNGARRWPTVRDALRGVPDPTRDGNKHHPNHTHVPGARSYEGHSGSPLDEPAKTLKAGVHGVPGGENMLRLPSGRVRYFTVHEAALLQSFPTDYVFSGSRTAAMRQIGNAAPPCVVEKLAHQIRRRLESAGLGGPGRQPHVDLVRGGSLTVL